MGLPVETKTMLQAVQERHPTEYGKVAQKLLAMTFIKMGFKLNEERAVQGVDIDIIDTETGERLSIEVKTSKSSKVSIGQKDVESLKPRKEDHYEIFYAMLSMPLCLSEGWVVVPAEGIKKGDYAVLRLARLKLRDLCDTINSAFPAVLKEVYPDLMKCSRGSALGMLKGKHNI